MDREQFRIARASKKLLLHLREQALVAKDHDRAYDLSVDIKNCEANIQRILTQE